MTLNETEDQDGLVSVIIPLYNAAAYIEQTMHSVEQQTYRNWELILVDDCGPDDSAAVAERIKEASPFREQIRIVHNEKNSGAAASRNHGVLEARGRYIAFLDADDLWKPDKLETQLRFLQEKNAGFTYTSYEFGDANAVGTGRIVHAIDRLDFRHALSRTVIFTSTVIFDTGKIDKSLIQMPDMPSEDTALWWTLLRKGFTAYGLDQVLTVYRRPAKSLSSNKSKSVQRVWNLLIHVAGCSKPEAVLHLIGWAFHATMRRL
ncbi:MAG: glycosyltransferase family 2 protein [Lachnospiraceae bacterium]|nr:glycosyltransferase family 2 protein [Lachnospiraceae bacterium]